MSPILYRLRQGLRQHFGSTAVLAVVVAVMLGLVLTLVAGAFRTLSAPDRFVSVWGGSFDAELEQSGGLPRTDEIAGLPGVSDVRSLTFVFGGLMAPGATDPTDGPEALVFAGSEVATGAHIVEGRGPDLRNPGEFVASRSFAERYDTRLGDSYQLVTLTQVQADASGFDTDAPAGPTTSATLVGVFDGASELQDGYGIVVFPTTLLDLGDVGVSASHSVVALEPGASLVDLRAQLDTLARGEMFTISPAEYVPETVRSAVRTQGQGLSVLAVFAAAASVAVIGQLLGRQHQLSDSERLALRSIGMTRSQLVTDPLSRAAVPVVVGAIGAAVIAISVSGLFPTGFVRQVDPDPGARFDPLVHLFGPIVLAILLLAWTATGLAVAGRPQPTRSEHPMLGGLSRRVGSAQLSTAVRFAFTGGRERRWPVASFIGLVVVVGVVVGALTVGANLGRLIDEPTRHGSPEFIIGSGGEQVPADVRTALETDAVVTALTFYGTVAVSVGAESLDITGLQPVKGDLSPDVLSGRLPRSDDEVALGSIAARHLGVGVGDDIAVAGAGGNQRLQVTGLAVIPGIQGGDGLGEGGVVTAAGLARVDPSATMGGAGFELRSGASADEIERLSERIGMLFGPGDRPSVILNLDRVRRIPRLVAATLTMLAVLSLAHQLVVSARHRRRDVGVLKAIGADGGFVTTVVHFQAMAFTAVVIALAVPIGIVAGQAVYRIFPNGVGARGDAMVPVGALAAAIVLPIVVANLVAVLPARRARRLRPALYLNQE